MKKEHLTAAFQLAQDRVTNQSLIVAGYVGLNRQAIYRRRFDDAQLANADQRHVQGARDRRRGETQNVDELAQLLEPFLVHHAKTLLFVDDDQTQILELDVFLQQTMGADEDIHFALSGLLQDLRDFLRREEAAHHFDAHRLIAKAMAKGLQVLLRENGRRRQHGDLLAAFDGEERRAHGDFGLAVADIATNQSVHRLLALHAGEGFVDGALLVRGFLILESGLEFFIQVVRRGEGGAGARLAQGVKLNQFFGHRKNRFACLGFDLFPSRAA